MVGTMVYIGNLPSETNERDLERFFRGYGCMYEVSLKNGYAFVEFEDYRDAEDAVYDLNGKKILGLRVTVEKARGTKRGRDQYYSRDRDYPSRDYNRTRKDRYGPPKRTTHRLIVENMSSRVSWQDLKDLMRQAGEVTFADAHKKRRNEGVVEFASSTDMRNALDKYDTYEINGRRIRLIEGKGSKRHSSRSSSYSSRSRSPRKSRSSSRSRSPKRFKSRSISSKKSSNRSRSNSYDKSDNRRSRSNTRPKSEVRDLSRSRPKQRSNSCRSKSEDSSRSWSEEREVKSRPRSRHDSSDMSHFRSRSRHSQSTSHEDN